MVHFFLPSSDHFNRRVISGFDVHQDTPVETLHTYLLGVVKYIWEQTIFNLKDHELKIVIARLNSFQEAGLNIPKINAEYMIRYYRSLLGKHFKALVQVMVFVVHDLVSETLLKAWERLGDIGILLWQTSISNIDTYLVN